MKYTEIDGKRIPIFGLEDGIEYAKEFAQCHLEQYKHFMLLAGAKSSSGKGQIEKGLRDFFHDDLLWLCLDDYYFGEPWMSENQKTWPDLNWDDPRAVELDLAAQHVMQLKKNVEIMKPCYKKETARRDKEPEKIDPRKVLYVEGNYSFANENLRNQADLKIFIKSSKHSRLVRRLLRDQLLGMSPSQTFQYVLDVVEPMADKYIEPTMKCADIIIENELIPEIECDRAGLFQQQLKFRKHFDPEQMRRKGAEYIISGKQTDRYYSASDQNISNTNQIVRIRDESANSLFTIKGPRREVDRAKFEFPISHDVAQRFPEFYGKEIFKIQKNRTLYYLRGALVAVDSNVERIKNGRYENLGNFVEVRIAHIGSMGRERIETAVSCLGLSMSDATAESYVNM
ncbi:MAG TPA: CYTH domain-containing protein [Candidatus Moranbacteria bacterium]|nr:CYTH domain-containing protein [Candidatus Moranbacteria bacterium]HRY27738.1 CYTH domain-containing protein [Candidatus Moranbacteria bacterium]HSA08535.1 CYTH domain-containing protein [Candidatus Moranbacteria bacterium]